MDFIHFRELAAEFNTVPVFRKMAADLLTPAAVYLSLRKSGVHGFLFESVEGSDTIGRYSFIGIQPIKIISNKAGLITVIQNGNISYLEDSIFNYLQNEFCGIKYPHVEGLPSFTGGLVGYLGYENISLIENVIKFNHYSENPDSLLGFYKTLIAFDHYKHQIVLITNVNIDPSIAVHEQYEKAQLELSKLSIEIGKVLNYSPLFAMSGTIKENITENDFKDMVLKAKKDIVEGDIFQIVLSKRFSTGFSGDLFNVYRALRIINPSPYMYFLELNGLTIIGTSPENLVKVTNGFAEVLPIAGTRKRGRNKDDDYRLEQNLLSDPKEQAEHVMLLDLGRNDLGRVCKYDTIIVKQNMKVQRYSHVMHLVSKVEGKLSENKTNIDALKACFPAGTVTGAPKIRAIQLINNYEPVNRNIYAGSIGYIDYSGNLDMCIAIRTLFANGDKIEWQAGAGIVADSSPELELKEINNKSAVMFSALKFAERINEDINY